MEDAVALVEEAAILAEHQRYGRAQALLVLAMEELAKAHWLYQAAADEWSRPLGKYGQAPASSEDVVVPAQLRSQRAAHDAKLATAERYAAGLDAFWGMAGLEGSKLAEPLTDFQEIARQRNADKQAGLYVDRAELQISHPLSVGPDGIAELMNSAACAIEMQLIEDHTRQKNSTSGVSTDSMQGLHWAILPYAHPEEWADFVERMERSAPVSASSWRIQFRSASG